MARKRCDNHPRVIPRDAIYELRRTKARVENEFDKIIRDVVGEGGIDEDYKDMLRLLAVENKAVPVPRKEKVDVEQRTKHVPTKKRKRKDQHDGLGTDCVKRNPRVIKNLVKKEKQCDRTNRAARKKAHGHLHDEDNKGNISLIHNQSERVARAQPVKICRKQVGRKLKGVVKEEYEANKKIVVKEENEEISRAQPVKICRKQVGRKLKGVVKEEYEANKKIVVKEEHEEISCCSRNYCKDVGQVQRGKEIVVHGKVGLVEVKKECDHRVETHLGMGGIPSRTRSAKCAKYSMAYGKYLEGRDICGPDPEVEILDHDMVVKEGIFSPFISSKKFMSDEKPMNLPSAKDEFRKELLEVLRKPFNIEEYKKCQEEIRAGPFLKHHQGVQKRLTKYRYKREKRLVILRGFFFWIQNLTREGAFRPWKDEECAAVQLPSS